MVKKVKFKTVYKRIRILHRLSNESFRDSLRYFRSNKPSSSKYVDTYTFSHLEAKIIKTYHVIEKGLSMPDFRPLFGKEYVKKLIRSINEAKENFPECYSKSIQVKAAHNVLREYIKCHQKLELDITGFLGDYTPETEELDCQIVAGVSKISSITDDHAKIFEEVLRKRRSVRHFDPNKMPKKETLEEAINMAMTAPSVCNRQSWRVHIYSGNKINEILSYQNGNRGFGHTIPCVMIITSDLRTFQGSIERYQSWIDGGMFSMNLLLSLHAKGLGAVALNWSVENKRDQELRTVADIPFYERIIMFIGCGFSDEKALAPISVRRSVAEITNFHN